MNNNTPHEGEMELAKRIADKLFTSGFGDKARRLVLELETDSHGCGWSKRPVIDLIARELAASRQPPLPDAEQKLREANRYALVTFRALDQYTFEDSDHALLIAEAVKKLEDFEG